MRKGILIPVFCLSVLTAFGQLTVGVKAGASPMSQPGTNPLIVNRHMPASEFQFNVRTVKFDGQIGLLTRYDKSPYWFSAEAMVSRSHTAYIALYSFEPQNSNAPVFLEETQTYLDIPVSAGVSLGKFEVFSGFTVTRNLDTKTELDQLDGYTDALQSWQFGWHTGAGVHLGMMTFDVRYQQAFSNYGNGRFVNGQELVLRNAPGRIVALVGIHLERS